MKCSHLLGLNLHLLVELYINIIHANLGHFVAITYMCVVAINIKRFISVLYAEMDCKIELTH